jgi:hypothetical protein
MSMTIGRIERSGTINFLDAGLAIWEEGISGALRWRLAGREGVESAF